MTAEEHRAEHAELHTALDTLVACFIRTELKRSVSGASVVFAQTSLLQFIMWSAYMVRNAQAQED